MKALKYVAIILGLLIVLSFIIFRGIENAGNRRISNLEGQFQAYQEKATEEKKEFLAERKKKEEEILSYKNKVVDLQNQSQEIRVKIEVKDEKIKKLEGEFLTLEDKDLMISNLQSQVSEWKEKFSLAMEDVANAKKQAGGWFVAYGHQVDITSGLDKQLKNTEALLAVSQKIVGEYKAKEKGLKIPKFAENFIIKPLAIYGSIKIIQGVVKK